MSILTDRKVLVPLATAALAGAIAIGSGADFTSSSQNTASAVTAGTLTQSNSKADAAIFNLTDIKPGDVLNGTVTITNTGSLPAIFTLTEDQLSDEFTAGQLTEKIQDVTDPAAPVTVYDDTFGDAGSQPLGSFAAGEARTYQVTVSLLRTATDAEQGKTASATYTWDATQESGSTTTNQ